MEDPSAPAASQTQESILQALACGSTGGKAVAAALAQMYPPLSIGTQAVKAMPVEDRQRLEQALRSVLERLVQAAAGKDEPMMQHQLLPDAKPAVPRLLELALWLCEHRYCDQGTIFTLLEDVVETTTIDDCEVVFRWLEARLDIFKMPHLNSNGKFPLLRTCNQLLRRLSRASNAQLCGRILIYLAKFMTLAERSGVNVLGAINTSHTTPVDDVQEGDVDSNGKPIDPAFYRTFWGLQSRCQAPWDVLKADTWAHVVSDIKAVLAAFQAQPVTAAGTTLGSTGGGDAVAPKYLSSSKLIHLQLHDAALRRHFLLQCIILLHACQHVKPPAEGLKPKQVAELQEVEGLLYEELQRTPDSGRDFAVAVRHLMRQESKWVQWKHDGCKEFGRTPTDFKTVPILSQRKRQRLSSGTAVRVGTQDLDRLWNLTPDNLSCLTVGDRSRVPTLRNLLGKVIQEMDPEECVEEQYRIKKDAVYNWKALRLLARSNLVHFQQTVTAGDLEEAVYLHFPGDVPSACPPEPPSKRAAKAKGRPLVKQGVGAAVPGKPLTSNGAPPVASPAAPAASPAPVAEPADDTAPPPGASNTAVEPVLGQPATTDAAAEPSDEAMPDAVAA